MCRVTDTMKNKDGTASFSETRTKIQRCNVKALIIAMTKKKPILLWRTTRKNDLSKAKKFNSKTSSILRHKDYCSDETCSGILLYVLVHRRKLSGF